MCNNNGDLLFNMPNTYPKMEYNLNKENDFVSNW